MGAKQETRTKSTSNVMTQAAFARLNGWTRAYVAQLKRDHRLVMSDYGKVLVRESMAEIKRTADPSKAYVAARHEAERQAKQASDGEGEQANGSAGGNAAGTFSAHKAQKERYNALMAQLDYQERIGNLVAKADVEAAAADFGAHLRRTLEGLPDQVAELVAAESDAARVHALLLEEIDETLAELSRHLRGVEAAA